MTESYYQSALQQRLLSFFHERLVTFCMKVTEHYTPLSFESRMQIGRSIIIKHFAAASEEYSELMDEHLPEHLHYKNKPN